MSFCKKRTKNVTIVTLTLFPYIVETSGDDPAAPAEVVGYNTRRHPTEAAGVCPADTTQERRHAGTGVASCTGGDRGCD